MTYKGIHEILKKAFVIYVPLSLLTPLLMYQWRDNNRLILMDRANSYHITEYTSDQQLRQLYEYQVKQAVFAFLMRNPNGFDNRELLGAMFVGTARQEAQKQFASEAAQFKQYKMHQKPEVLNIRILRADRRRSFARVSGQLIRYYVTPHNEQRTFTLEFELNLELQVNYDTANGSRYPFITSGDSEMKLLSSLALAFFTAVTVMANEPTPEEIRLQNQYIEYRLMQGEIYRICVKMNDGVTTIQFPSGISEIAGKNISVDGKGTDFQIAAQPGSYYFNVSALKPGVSTTLTVTYNRQLYILYLIQSDKEAYASVVFGKSSGRRNFTDNVVTSTPKVTPARLVSLIDMAKKYDVLKETYPDSLAGVERVLFRNRYRCGKYDIHLDEAIRFEEEDTVIFKLRLTNLTENEIKYDKHSFSAHAGDGIYYMSVSDASGIMPPKSETYAWFGITSTPRGGRNNLKADNDWLIALTTQEMYLENIQSVKNELKEKERIEAEKAALLKEQAKEAEKKIQTAEQLMKELKRQQEEFALLKAEMEHSFAEIQRRLEAEKEETVQKLQNAVQLEEDAREKAKQMLESADQRLKAEIKTADLIRRELDKEIEERKAQKADLEREIQEKSVLETQNAAVSSLKSMRKQTQENVRAIQQRTEDTVRRWKPSDGNGGK